jgi:hypothetical protein
LVLARLSSGDRAQPYDCFRVRDRQALGATCATGCIAWTASSAVAYGLLTLVLGGGYAIVVLGLGQLLGRRSSLTVAAATLTVAGMFQPARRRIQVVVDRRSNRRKYDAAKTVEAFRVRLRDEVDLDALSAELLAVADRTMQPSMASLWLRPTAQVPPRAQGRRS